MMREMLGQLKVSYEYFVKEEHKLKVIRQDLFSENKYNKFQTIEKLKR